MYKDVCKSLMDFYEQHQYLNIGVLGINLLNSENKASHSYGNFPRSFKTEHRKRNIIKSVETYSLVDVIIGADMFIPKDLFLAFYMKKKWSFNIGSILMDIIHIY